MLETILTTIEYVAGSVCVGGLLLGVLVLALAARDAADPGV